MEAQTKIVPIGDGLHVWTRRVGKSPIKILLLHGGPGSTHEYLEPFADYLPQEGIEIYFYDQLGSYHSDQPDDPTLWTMDRFREEVETVRKHLDLKDFYLYGSSFGGFLAIEYAIKYQANLKGLILSNTTASIASYIDYINELREKLPEDILSKIKAYEEKEMFNDPNYAKLIKQHLDNQYICRLDPWPATVIRGGSHKALQVYNTMHGPNEFIVTGNYGAWNRWDDLHKIKTETLVLGAKYDSMSIADQERMGSLIPNSRVNICPKGSHLSMWDDPENYFRFIKKFVEDVEANN